jgi:hypothetical protein
MQPENSHNAVQSSDLDHFHRALARLFGWLEDRSNSMRRPKIVDCNDLLYRTQSSVDDGRVRIVSTGVHHSVALTAVRHVLFILNSQGINIGSQADSGRHRAEQIRDNTATVNPHADLESHVTQFLVEHETGLTLLTGELRVLM